MTSLVSDRKSWIMKIEGDLPTFQTIRKHGLFLCMLWITTNNYTLNYLGLYDSDHHQNIKYFFSVCPYAVKLEKQYSRSWKSLPILKLKYFNWSNTQGYFFFQDIKGKPCKNKTIVQDILTYRRFNYSCLCKLHFLIHGIEHWNEQVNVNILVL